MVDRWPVEGRLFFSKDMPLPFLLVVPPTIACGGYASWSAGYNLVNSKKRLLPAQTTKSYVGGLLAFGGSYLALAPKGPAINFQKATFGQFASAFGGRAAVATVSFALAGATQAWLVK